MRKANDEIRRVVHTDAGDRVPFFCECEREDCFEPIWFSLDEYDLAARNPRRLSAHPGRQPFPRPGATVPLSASAVRSSA
jgi:hypothetical protein